ncbi:MAG: glycine dehydrogenase, partial [Caldiserica bacterium]
MKYIPLTEEDKRKMLEEMGITSISSLFSDIPEEVLLNRDLNLPPPLSEKEVISLIKKT